MACKSTKSLNDINSIISKIKEFPELKPIKLNEFELKFDSNTGEWITNNTNQQQISPMTQSLREENKKLDQELENLEKEYLVKVNQLLIMAQMHCEIKSELNVLFDELGVSHDSYVD